MKTNENKTNYSYEIEQDALRAGDGLSGLETLADNLNIDISEDIKAAYKIINKMKKKLQKAAAKKRSEDMEDYDNERAKAAEKEIETFISRYGNRKPMTFEEIDYGNIEDLTENAQAFIEIFPVYKTEEDCPRDVEILTQHQHSLLKRGEKSYLVDNSGYNYPRYIVRIG